MCNVKLKIRILFTIDSINLHVNDLSVRKAYKITFHTLFLTLRLLFLKIYDKVTLIFMFTCLREICPGRSKENAAIVLRFFFLSGSFLEKSKLFILNCIEVEVREMEKEKKVPRITHVMADSSVRDSVKGYKIPVDNPVYILLAKWARECCEEDGAAQKQGDS